MEKFVSTPKTWFFIILVSYLVVFSHGWMPSPSGTGLDLPIVNIGWWTFSLLICCALYQIYKNQKLHFDSSCKWILLLVASLVAPIFYGSEYPIDFYIGRIVGVLGLAVLIIAIKQFDFTQRDFFVVILAIIASLCIEVFLGVSEIIKSVVSEDNRLIQLKGSLNQPNVFVSFIAVGWGCVALCVLEPGFRQYIKIDKFVYFLYGLLFFCSVLVGICGSRIGLIALLFSLLILCLYYIKATEPLSKKVWVVVFVTCLSLLLGNFTGDILVWLGGIEEKMRIRGALDFTQRLVMYENSIRLIAEKPLIGHGYGSFDYVYLNSYASLVNRDALVMASSSESNLNHPHNEILYWFVEGGVVPVLGMLAFSIFIVYKLFKAPRLQGAFAIVLMAPVALHSMTEFPLYVSGQHILMLAIGAFLVLSQEHENTAVITIGSGLATMFKLSSLLVGLLCSIFFASSLQAGYQVGKYLYSQPTTTRYLMEIYNPLPWKNDIDFYWYSALADKTNKKRTKSGCRKYIDWAERQLLITHHQMYYQFLLEAYDCVGDKAKHDALEKKIAYLYPEKTKALSSLKKAVKE